MSDCFKSDMGTWRRSWVGAKKNDTLNFLGELEDCSSTEASRKTTHCTIILNPLLVLQGRSGEQHSDLQRKVALFLIGD